MSKAFKCDQCQERFDGEPKSISDITVGDFKINMHVYPNKTDSYTACDLCEVCKAELIADLVIELGRKE